MSASLRVLLLADDQKGHPNTIHDHIGMFPRHSRHDIRVFNPRGLKRSRFLDLDAFDVLVIHYSIVVIWDAYLAPAFREQIRRFDGLKVQFLQDEYRWVDAITAEMRRLGIDVLYSVVPPHKFEQVYGDRLPDTDLLPTLTGYVPERIVGVESRRSQTDRSTSGIEVGRCRTGSVGSASRRSRSDAVSCGTPNTMGSRRTSRGPRERESTAVGGQTS